MAINTLAYMQLSSCAPGSYRQEHSNPGGPMKSTLQPLSTLAVAMFFLFASSSFGQSFHHTFYDSPNAPSDIFMSDLNHDGKPDLLTSQSISNAFTVFLNHGSGTFTNGGSLSFIAAGRDVNHVVAADFNGDGNIDVAAQSCSSVNAPTITVFFGNGDGTFTRNRDYSPSIGLDCKDSLGLITLPGSQLPSLILSANINQIAILKNDGHGVFAQQKNIFTSTNIRISSVSAGDYNGDHLKDIAAILTNLTDPAGPTDHVVIFYAKADGTFHAPVTLFSRLSSLQAVNTVDFNGDGRGDLLVPFSGGPDNRAGVIAFTNLGGGSFRTTTLTADPIYIAAAGKAAAIHPAGNQPGLRGIMAPLSIEGGHGAFAFFPAQGTSWGKPIYFDDPIAGLQAVVNVDFNGDGRPDFAAISGDKLIVFLNTTTAATCPFPSQAGVRICSPDGDGDADDTSRTVRIHTSSSGGALPIFEMHAFLDGKRVAAIDANTLDVSVTAKPGKHTLTVDAMDPAGKTYTKHVTFTVR